MNISFLRGLRLLRAVRATRALRTIRQVQQLRLMVASIISSLPSLGWAFVLLMLLLYLYALIIMQGAENFIRHQGRDQELESLYGDIGTAVLTLFMAISGGKEWGECVAPLHQVSRFYVLLFVLFVTFVVFGVVNILTAVFIDASAGIIDVDRDLVVQRHRTERDSTVRHLQRLFEDSGVGTDGRVTREQMSSLFDREDTAAVLQTLGIEVESTHDFMRLLDLDRNNEVDIGEFVVALLRIRGPARGMDQAKNLSDISRMRGEMRHLTQIFESKFEVPRG